MLLILNEVIVTTNNVCNIIIYYSCGTRVTILAAVINHNYMLCPYYILYTMFNFICRIVISPEFLSTTILLIVATTRVIIVICVIVIVLLIGNNIAYSIIMRHA